MCLTAVVSQIFGVASCHDSTWSVCRAGGGNRGESECGADAAAVEAGAEAGVETGAAEAAGTEAASTDQMDAISQLELLLGGS
jgi:hypothetical protein